MKCVTFVICKEKKCSKGRGFKNQNIITRGLDATKGHSMPQKAKKAPKEQNVP